MAIIAVSDQHLGIETSDKQAFLRFLSSLQSDSSVTDLVLLGDVVDMWRRDASGVFLENKDVFDIIIALQKKMRVYYVAGNHDFHVLKLQDPGYPLKFVKNVVLQADGTNYRFVHGWEFDEMQKEHFMESLCHAMSDQKGERDDHIWAALSRDKTDIRYVFGMLLRRGSIRESMQALQVSAEERLLEGNLKGVERKAYSTVRPGEVLIFGHTHRPFITQKEDMVNTGSWVKTSPIHNTYVRLERGKPRLFVFEGEEIKERSESGYRAGS